LELATTTTRRGRRQYLEQLVAAYPTAPVVAVICDNVIIHHSKIVQRWLAAHPRMLVLHGARDGSPRQPVSSGCGARGGSGQLW